MGLSVAIDQIMDAGDFSRGDVIDALDEFDGDVNAAYIVLQSTESMLQEEAGFTTVDQLMDAGGFSRTDVVTALTSSRDYADPVYKKFLERCERHSLLC